MKWWRHWIIKLVAIIIVLVNLGVGVVSVIEYRDNYLDLNQIVQTYPDFEYELYSNYETIINYLLVYQSKEHIQAGNLVNMAEVQQRYQSDYEMQFKEILTKYNLSIAEYEQAKTEQLINDEIIQEIALLDEQHTLNISKYKESIIRSQLAKFKTIEDDFSLIKKNTEYVLFLKNDEIITNLDIELTNNEIAVYFLDHIYYDTYNMGYYYPAIGGYDVAFTPESVSEVYIGLKNDYVHSFDIDNAKYVEYNAQFLALNNSLLTDLSYVFISIMIALCYLTVVAGQSHRDDTIVLNPFDHIYVDVLTVMGIVSLYILFYIFIEIANASYFVDTMLALMCIVVLFFIVYIMSISKHFKKRDLLTHTLVFKLTHTLFNFVGRRIQSVSNYVFRTESISKSIKILIVCGMVANVLWIACCLACVWILFNGSFIGFCMMMIVGFIGEYAVILGLFSSYNADLENIKAGVNIIQQGDLDFKIVNLHHDSLRIMANDINSISDGLKISVNKAVQSEKMKSELVTNVSHDLKTPLTSIINYIDLLSTKEEMDEDARHYIDIVVSKSNQLKKLVEDLFEMTKAQSGQIKVELAPLCIDDLITQSLVEFEEKLNDKKLNVRISAFEKKCYVIADGNRTWRVLSNIIGNIVKYSQDNTRVYINYEMLDNEVRISFKNMSNYEMNFVGSEVQERFNRGDKSRNSEGNGLGLAIATSFMELQACKLEINVDGDLFKVILSFPLATDKA